MAGSARKWLFSFHFCTVNCIWDTGLNFGTDIQKTLIVWEKIVLIAIFNKYSCNNKLYEKCWKMVFGKSRKWCLRFEVISVLFFNLQTSYFATIFRSLKWSLYHIRFLISSLLPVFMIIKFSYKIINKFKYITHHNFLNIMNIKILIW